MQNAEKNDRSKIMLDKSNILCYNVHTVREWKCGRDVRAWEKSMPHHNCKALYSLQKHAAVHFAFTLRQEPLCRFVPTLLQSEKIRYFLYQ